MMNPRQPDAVSLTADGSESAISNELPWQQFLAKWQWVYKQDEHVTIIGPTGSGKTQLARRLVERRGHVVALGIKPRDDSMAPLLKQDWHRVEKWSNRPKAAKRILLWPKIDDPEQATKLHKDRFSECLRAVYKQGGWCVWADELRYLTHQCRMSELFQQMYVTARSNKISLVAAAQRPKWIPLEAMSQASHLFLYKTGHEADLISMGALNGTNAKQVANIVANLPKHTFLHINMWTGEQTISQVQL